MVNFRSIMEIEADEWLAALALPADDVPDVVIVEGSWWRAQRTAWRLGYLRDVRELKFPDIFWGRWGDRKVAFCMAYGAPRTVEIIHLFGALGSKLAVQIGTCGGLQAHLNPGDIILPDVAICREGVAHMYGAPDAVLGDSVWLGKAQHLLEARGLTAYRGPNVTWSSLFTETAQMVAAWHQAGYLSVEMETATTYAVARYFEMPAVSMVVVWDDLTRGRRFLDPLPPGGQEALDRSNQAVFEVALELAAQL
ncbi:MAG: nucleoside phosphorylase [Chloroflexi bacterium]|nr:nucleoside phosphorylase [Chloroflexota bacterium]